MNFHTIITCINFTDYLRFVYPYNSRVLKNLTILSSTTDKETQQFCVDNNIDLYQTDTFFKNNHFINRAAATNEFLLNHYDKINQDEWILFTDADIIFTEPVLRLQKLIGDSMISKDGVVSCPRKIYKNYKDYPNGNYTIENIGFFGYFQFFNKQIIMPEILHGIAPLPEHTDVSQHDLKFINKYWSDQPNKKIYLKDYYAVHCGCIGKHWKGRQYD